MSTARSMPGGWVDRAASPKVRTAAACAAGEPGSAPRRQTFCSDCVWKNGGSERSGYLRERVLEAIAESAPAAQWIAWQPGIA